MLQRHVDQRVCLLIGLGLVSVVGSTRLVQAGIEYDEVVTIEKSIFGVNCPISVSIYLDCLDCGAYPWERFCQPLEDFYVDAHVGGACFVWQSGSCGEPFFCAPDEDLDTCPWWEPDWGLPEGPCWFCGCQRCTYGDMSIFWHHQGPYCQAFTMQSWGTKSFTIESETPGYGVLTVRGSRPCQLHPPLGSKHFYDHFSGQQEFIVVEPLLGVDSNNDGVYNGADEAIEDQWGLPGLYVGMNDNFDEEDTFEDWGLPIRASKKPCPANQYPEVPLEDLEPIHVSLLPGGDDLCSEVGLYLKGGRDRLRIYAVKSACDVPCPDTGEDNCWVVIGSNYDLAANYLHSQGSIHGWALYAEGIAPGETQMTLEVRDGGDPLCDDKVNLTVVKIDVDVDSDNTATTQPYAPDESIEEDRIEQRAGEPGRLIPLNADDDDQDGILDHNDGYNKDGTSGNADDRTYKDGTHKEDDFVMLKVKIAPTSIDLDPNKAWMYVDYSAASPDPNVWTIGRIRLWKKPGDQPRDNRSALPDLYAGEGDWIAPGLYTDLGELTPSGTASHEMTFYIEGVNPSGTLGDTDITFWLDPDGPGPAGYVHADTVQVTVHDFRVDLDVDSDNTVANGMPERTPEEDSVEMEGCGKVIPVNVNNDDDNEPWYAEVTDHERIDDFGDGYNRDQSSEGLVLEQDNSNPMESDLVPMVVEMPAPIDLSHATFRLIYDHPSAPMQVVWHDFLPCWRRELALPLGAALRVWSGSPAPQRNPQPIDTVTVPAGQYVEPARDGEWLEYPATILGLTEGSRTATLYIEGVAPGYNVITLEVDPDGPDGPIPMGLVSDQVVITPANMSIKSRTANPGLLVDHTINPAGLMLKAGQTSHVWFGSAPYYPGISPSFEFQSLDEAVVSILDTDWAGRFVEVEFQAGLQDATTIVQATFQTPGQHKAMDLRVCVLERKRVSVQFHNVQNIVDGQLLRSANGDSSRAEAALAEMNEIWGKQANIYFEPAEGFPLFDPDPVVVKRDLGAVVQATLPSEELIWITLWANDYADMNIFWVWNVEADQPPDDDPSHDEAYGVYCGGGNILIDDVQGCSDGHACAHEFGHHVSMGRHFRHAQPGFDGDPWGDWRLPDNLMFADCGELLYLRQAKIANNKLP